jgi:uncharacterized membrane protein YphA (DoxX/SURF4 family)
MPTGLKHFINLINTYMSKFTLYSLWFAKALAALIMLQTLFFKFTGADESVYIFTKVGIEPWGRYGTGVAELIASILLFVPGFSWLGAIMGAGIMAGALLSHLTLLGIEVKEDGGQLFYYALTVLVACLYILYLKREEGFAFFEKFLKKTS